MTPLGDGWRRAFRVFQRPVERDVDDELEFHFEQRIAELIAGGASPGVARAQTEREFGERNSVRQRLVVIDRRAGRRRSVFERMQWLTQDLGYVVRSLGRSPGFVVTVVLTLSLGLGANVAIFSILDRLFLSPPPGIANPGALRRIQEVMPADRQDSRSTAKENVQSVFAYPQFQALADGIVGAQFAGYSTNRARLEDHGASIDANVQSVIGDYFGVLGVHPQLGRGFTPDELRPETPRYLSVIGDGIWRTYFGADPHVVGRVLRLDGQQYTVIGVAPSGFHGAENDAATLWTPMNTMTSGSGPWYIGTHTFWIRLVMQPPANAVPAQVALRGTLALHHDGIPWDTAGRIRLQPLARADDGFNTQAMSIAGSLSGVAAIMLLIACANIANLLLARGMYRRHEIGVRLALGVSRMRLFAMLLAESLAVSVLGAAAGLLVAWRAAAGLRALLLPRVRWIDSTVNWHVIAFATGVALLTGVLAGLAPAWQLSRPNLAAFLKGGARESAGGRARTRTLLLLTQSALSVMLMAAAGMFLRSLLNVERQPTGFDVDRVISVQVTPRQNAGAPDTAIARRLPALAASIGALPGVDRTALTDMPPMWGVSFLSWYIPGRDTTQMFVGAEGPSVSWVGPGYFETAGMRVLAGRGFRPGDEAGGTNTIIVNQRMAEKLWPGANPLLQCLQVQSRSSPCRQVVGIVSDTHQWRLIEGPTMHFYLPLTDSGGRSAGAVLVHAAPGVAGRVANLIMKRFAPRFAGWADVRVLIMSQQFDRELQPWRAGATLFAASGLLALLVAMVGIYSTVSYTFSQRTRELGIRIALGARNENVVRLVLGEGVRVVMFGVALGIAATMAAGRLVASMLYHTTPHDPAVLALAAAALGVSAVVASWLPARRALRVDPIVALRAE